MAKWTDIAAGVWGTFGDSLPIEGLTEASNETAKVGKLTGVLADALNWAGINEDDFQASLDACNSEQERAQLITETLNGLYSKAAGHYRENNASVIEARKATSEYTDTMAELGELMEPVTTEVTKFKSELAKELAPVLKDEVAPAIKEFMKQLKDNKIIDKAGKLVSSLAKNFGTITKVTLTAVTAYAAFNAALKVSTAIKAAQAAMSGLSAATGAATVAQTGLNAAMAANPIGAVITAIALLTAGIGLLIASSKKATQSTEVLSESQREAVKASSEAAEAYRDTKEAADELAASQMANVNYVQNNLLPQLQDVIDANGQVKAGEEARANFILNELNNALGTEYDSLSAIVDANGNIKDSIYDVIEAKKAQFLLEAYEESYREALIKVGEAEAARATEAIALAERREELAAATTEAEQAQSRLDDAVARGSESEVLFAAQAANAEWAKVREKQAAFDEELAAYNEADANIQSYYNAIDGYETASTLVMQGETAKAVEMLQGLSTEHKAVGSTAEEVAENRKKALEQDVINTQINVALMKDEYKRLSATMTEEEKKQAEERIKAAKKEADDAIVKFNEVGGNITKGIAEGAEKEEWTLTSAMQGLIDKAVAAAKNRMDSHSPSRRFRKEVGKMAGLGVALGVDDSTKDVVKSVKRQVEAMSETYDLGGFSNSVNAGIKSHGSGNTVNGGAVAGSVIVNQTNNYSQAHSRFEIYKSKQQTEAAVRLAMGV